MMKRASWVLAVLSLLTLGVGGAEVTLIDAVKAGNREAVGALLKAPAGAASVNIAEADGTTCTSLGRAVRSGDIARRFVAAGANANAANRYGLDPVVARRRQRQRAVMVKLLLDAGADASGDASPGRDGPLAAARTGTLNPSRCSEPRRRCHAREKTPRRKRADVGGSGESS